MDIHIFGKDFYVRFELVIAISLVVSFLCGFAGYNIGTSQETGITIQTSEGEINKTLNTGLEKNNISKKNELPQVVKEVEEIKVYIVGCVNKPGLIKLPKGSVLFEAVAMAGGATEKADFDNINMAYTLNENCMIKVYSKNQTKKVVANKPISKSEDHQIIRKDISNNSQSKKNINESNKSRIQSSNLKGNEIKSKTNSQKSVNKAKAINGPISNELKKSADTKEGYSIVTDSGKSLVGEVSSKNDNKENNALSDGKVNINTAGMDELDTLSGIGKSTAADIISFRERNGEFKRIEDIMKVPGIKEKTFTKIKDRISV